MLTFQVLSDGTASWLTDVLVLLAANVESNAVFKNVDK